MKTVKIAYRCDYCGEVIDQDNEAVMAVFPGRIGYQDSFVPGSDDKIQHYHDYCMEYVLTMSRNVEIPETVEAPEPEPEPDPEPEEPEKEKKSPFNPHHKSYYGPITPGVKDLPALDALIDAGWTQTKCAQEFSVSPSTIYVWKTEINNMKAAGTWDEYCEERRSKK